jgi:hypothetical protein
MLFVISYVIVVGYVINSSAFSSNGFERCKFFIRRNRKMPLPKTDVYNILVERVGSTEQQLGAHPAGENSVFDQE